MRKIMSAVIIFAFLLSGCSEKEKEKPKNVCDSDCVSANMSEYTTLKEDHVFLETNFKKSNAFLKDENFTGIIYYGFPDCPWCEEAIPLMNKVAKKNKLNIFYVNKRSEENIADKKGEKEATQILDKAYKLAKGKDGKPLIFAPEVVIVKEGKIIAHHMGTVEGHDAHERVMHDDEKDLLKSIYEGMFKKIK